MSGSKYVLFVVYIRTLHLIKYGSIILQELSNMYKTNHMKKVIEDLNVLRKYSRVRQYVNYDIQTIISFIKYGIQTSIETHISCKKAKENYFGLIGMN